MKNLIHGTHTGYIYGCRCDDCRTAASAYVVALQRRRRDEGVEPPVHGVLGGDTNYMCRCDACREAARLHARSYRRRRAAAKFREAS
ncbi:MAG TPA: hypothetical protein VF506_02125 [Streptosporangiaceae bacterium]